MVNRVMDKRGQVAVFVVIGIVLIILIALIFVGRQQYGFGVSSTKFLQSKLDPIKEDTENCVDESVANTLKQFSEQGGSLNPNRYVLYEGRKVNYLCYNIDGKDECINMMTPLNIILDDLQDEVQNDISSCVNQELVESGLGYDIVVSGGPEAELKLVGDDLRVMVDYDVEIIKGESRNKLGLIERSLDIPLVELYNVAFDVVNSHASSGFFEQLFYMLNKKGNFIINVDKSPSLGNNGDIIYKINKKDSDFEFWFAVEGE